MKELLLSNNLEDVILGIRMLKKGDLEEYFNKHNGYTTHVFFGNFYTASHIIHTNIGAFWLTSNRIYYTEKDYEIDETDIFLNFRDEYKQE